LDVSSSELFSTGTLPAYIGSMIGYPEQESVGGLDLHVSCSPSTGAGMDHAVDAFGNQYWNVYDFFG
jgi:hypothetical protein